MGCEDTTCGWRENGGLCEDCKIKQDYIVNGPCTCPLQLKKSIMERWKTKKLLTRDVYENGECDCGCSGKN